MEEEKQVCQKRCSFKCNVNVNVNVVGLNVKGKVESQASQGVHNFTAMITVKYFILYKLIAL